MKKKKFLSIALFLTLIITVIFPAGTPAYATSDSYVIDVGDTNAAQTLPTGVTYDNVNKLFNIDTGTAADTITVTGDNSTSQNTIVVAGGVSNLTLILDGVSITAPSGSAYSPIDLQGTADVTLQLADDTTSTMSAINASRRAGIHAAAGTTLTITGTGSLVATGNSTYWGAGIGGGSNSFSGEDGGTITITDSANVTAAGGKNSAGIGGSGSNAGGHGAGGEITINGSANVTATGGYSGAGIGGGTGTGGAITIGGSATVNAAGGNGGAGIGGGTGGAGGNITIDGGTVRAIATGSSAAGIGGGNAGDGGTIEIRDGIVTAKGDWNGAGIGGGITGSGGSITISGGTVTATGGASLGAGIGGGYGGAGGNITIGTSAVVLSVSKDAAGKPAIDASSGSGNVINTILFSAYSASDSYLKCNGNILMLPASYMCFAFSTAAASYINAYSDSSCNPATLLGGIATDPAGAANIPVTDLGISPTNITAVMLQSAYALTVNLDGGSGSTVSDSYAAGAVVSIDAGTKSGYTFNGWSSSNGGMFGNESSASTTFTMPGNATTITASWTPVVTIYALTVNLDGGNGATVSGSYAAGAPVSIDAGTKSGFTFNGWSSSNGGTFDDESSASTTFTMPGNATTITASWTPVVTTYALTVNLDGGSGATVSGSYAAGTAVSIDAGTKSGFTFNGWSSSDSGTFDDESSASTTFTMPGNATTITASWTPVVTTYALTVNLDGGNGATVSGSYAAGAPVSIDAGTKSGFTFNGWSSSNGGMFGNESSASTTFTMPGNATTITAGWTPVVTTYALTVNLNGGSGSTVSGSYASGTAVSIDAGTKIGYTFNGWSSSNGGMFGNESSASTTFTMPGNATTITAGWTQNHNPGNGGVSDTTPATPANNNTTVVVDDEEYFIGTERKDGPSTTVTVDQNELTDGIEKASENSSVIFRASANINVTMQLVVKNIEDMAEKDMILTVQTGGVSYNLKTSAIDTSKIKSSLGNANSKDIPFNVSISNSNATVKGYEVVVSPVTFNVTATYNGGTVYVDTFSSFVDRAIVITADQAKKITTGIVVNPDGTVRHVPTKVTVIGGKYYAVINSLTNSTYAVIWNPVEFSDVRTSWARASVNDMGSRMVVNGVGDNKYNPDLDITRAEFAAIMVRALGLAPGTGSNDFKDVAASEWYYGYIKTASAYGIVHGYSTTVFGPDDRLTREQAMTMIAKAMEITGLKPELKDSEIRSLLAGYSDGTDASVFARTSIAACLKTGIITGRSGDKIAPKSYVTRAEVAVMVQKLLQKSGLI